MERQDTPSIFTPDNEPYLGRPLLHAFDTLISATLDLNAKTAPMSHGRALTDHQRMACLEIAQALSLALSIRELIRQGYLFGGHVLVRPIVERGAILLYLHLYPADIGIWNRGWTHKEAPGLAAMLDRIQTAKRAPDDIVRGTDLTASMNSLLHAKPDSAQWNLIPLQGDRHGHAVSKILNRPDLCDDLCGNVVPWLAIVVRMMAAYFPDEVEGKRPTEI